MGRLARSITLVGALALAAVGLATTAGPADALTGRTLNCSVALPVATVSLAVTLISAGTGPTTAPPAFPCGTAQCPWTGPGLLTFLLGNPVLGATVDVDSGGTPPKNVSQCQ
jgi:hypothetical protein